MIATQEKIAMNGSASHERAAAEQALPAYLEAWHILLRGKWRIAFLLLLGLAGATLFCFVAGPRYDSSSQLLVIKKRLETMPITGPDQARGPDDYLSTHMLLITSRKVVGRAISKGNLQDLPQFQDKPSWRRDIIDWVNQVMVGGDQEVQREEKLTTDIINSLLVTRDAQRPGINPSNEVINLSFRGLVSADGPKVINAIIESYQEFLKDTYRNTNAETVELIAQARVMVQKDLEVKEAAYQAFLKETTLLKKTDRSTAQQDRLFKLDAKLAALRVRRTEIEASIAMIESTIKSGRNANALVMRMIALPSGDAGALNPMVSPDPKGGRVSLEEELVNLQLLKAKLEANYPAGHVDVLAVNRQLQAVRRLLMPTKLPESSSGEIDLAAIKIELLRQERDGLKASEDGLMELFKDEQVGVNASYIHEIQDEAHKKGIERDRMLYESILNRLNETSSVKDFGGYNTQVIGAALPGTLALRRYLLAYGLSAFAGLFLGFAWAYFAEMAARRAR